VVLGLLLYYGYFEKQAADLEPQVLLPTRRIDEPLPEPSVVVALHDPDHVSVLLDFAAPVARARGRRLVAIAVVDVPEQLPIYEGMRFAHHKEPLQRAAQQHGVEHDIAVETDMIIAHKVQDGIFKAVERHRADMLVLRWKGFTNTRERVFGEVTDAVIRYAPCDLMVLKIAPEKQFRSCFLPTAGGPNAQLAADLLNELSVSMDMTVTAGFIVPEGATAERRAAAEGWIEKTLVHMDVKIPVEKRLIESKSVPGGLALASRDFDLVVIGAAKEPLFRKMLLGEIPEKVARYSPASVLIVKRYEGPVKSLVKRVLG
jgi:nucleotide-binding universal stress UspA family protein